MSEATTPTTDTFVSVRDGNIYIEDLGDGSAYIPLEEWSVVREAIDALVAPTTQGDE